MSRAEEILSAEFWVIENYKNNDYIISFEMMNAYAKYLHQSEVNAINDEDIMEASKNSSTDYLWRLKFKDGAKWFKQKLLKK